MSFSNIRGTQSAAKAPKTAIGVLSSTLHGSDQLSYSAARIRNTNSSESAKITHAATRPRGGLLLVRHAR